MENDMEWFHIFFRGPNLFRKILIQRRFLRLSLPSASLFLLIYDLKIFTAENYVDKL